jgi:hypothetical protein
VRPLQELQPVLLQVLLLWLLVSCHAWQAQQQQQEQLLWAQGKRQQWQH